LGPGVATSQQAVSGTESDSDSILSPENLIVTPSTSISGGAIYTSNVTQPPLDSIAEGPLVSEDSEDDRDALEDGDGSKATHRRGSSDETIIKSGYLWKKGERRKVRNDSRPSLHGVSSQVANVFVSCIYIRLGRSVGSF